MKEQIKNVVLVIESDEHNGTGEAVSFVKDGYEGHCKVIFHGCANPVVAVFETYKQAYISSVYALSPEVGGYSDTEIHETTETVTNVSAQSWLFDED